MIVLQYSLLFIYMLLRHYNNFISPKVGFLKRISHNYKNVVFIGTNLIYTLCLSIPILAFIVNIEVIQTNLTTLTTRHN